jgi:F-type H+-transporting ATPase subunit delta
MSDARIARRYSKALVAICDKDKSHESVGRDLDKVVDALSKEPAVRTSLSDPSVKSRTKAEVIKSMARSLVLRPMTTNFLLVLNEKDRMSDLAEIRDEFGRRLDVIAGRVRAKVVSARPLTVIEKKRVEDSLKKATGKTVVMDAAVDERLLGGVVTKIGNLVFDGSVRTQLDTLKTRLRLALQ